MSQVCCLSGLENYGRGVCPTQIDTPVGIIAVNQFDSANAVNQIDLTAAFTSSTLTGLITNADPTKRWVKLPRFYGVTLPIADTVFDEAADGTKSFVRDGIWSFMGEVRDKDAVAAVLGKMKAMRCSNWAGFVVTKSNQLVGIRKAGATTMQPLAVNGGSLDPKMMMRDDANTNKIMFGFDFDNLVKQEQLYVLDGNDLGVDFLGMRQLTDVNIVQTSTAITATTIEVDLRTDFANGLLPNNDVVGLLAASFVLKNLTTAATVTITSVAENVTIDGRYLVTFPAQTATNRLELSLALSSFYNGKLEFTAV